ncbi:MAG: diphthine--ammonia ligase [Leptospiraceae bacterium]
MESVVVNWSGGKDSCFALYRTLEAGWKVESLLTTLQQETSELPSRVSHHEVPETLLDKQALMLGLQLHKVFLPDQPSNEKYESIMRDAMNVWSHKGLNRAVFGDIFLEDLKKFREQKLESIGWKAQFPLWKYDTAEMAREFIDLGFRAVIVSVDGQKLGSEFCGRIFDSDFLNDIPKSVDPCGEYGEFHTFVFDGPMFQQPVEWAKGPVYSRTYSYQGADLIYHYQTLKPV